MGYRLLATAATLLAAETSAWAQTPPGAPAPQAPDTRSFRQKVADAERALDLARARCDEDAIRLHWYELENLITLALNVEGEDAGLRQMLANHRANRPNFQTCRISREEEQAELFFGGGLTRAETPPVNYGFRRDGPAGSTEEREAGRSARNVSLYWFGGTLTLPDFGEIFGAYAGGSERTSFAVPVLGNGGASGIINTNEAPSGSTGVTADFGVTGESRTSQDSVELGYRRFFKLGDGGPAAPQARIFIGFSGYYERRDHDASLLMSGTTGGGFNFSVTQNLGQRVETLRIGPLAGLDVVVPIAAELIFRAAAQAGVQYYDFDLRSLERRTQNIGPASDQNFENRTVNGRSGVNLEASLRAIVELRLSNRTALSMMAMVTQMSHRPQVVNPTSGDDVLAGTTPHLENRSATDLRFGAGLRIQFR